VAENESTFRFVLKQPFAAFLSAIASGYFGIASPEAVKKAEATTALLITVGTGPFIFKEWRSGDRVVLKRTRTTGRRIYAGKPVSDAPLLTQQRGAQLRSGTDFWIWPLTNWQKFKATRT